jgi:SAM-dependent methyltransferase
LQEWFLTPPGRYLIDWERSQFDSAVADVFGYHAVQLGLPQLAGLYANRMPQRWVAGPGPGWAGAVSDRSVQLVTDFEALPFAESSLDLVLLPHALELGADPHALLREVERVLVPEGRLIISGLNPASLWGLRQRRAHLYQRLGWGDLYLPQEGEFIGYRRLRDWLSLLGFEVETARFGCYRPAVDTEAWLRRFAWMDRLGARSWPIFGAVYFVVAIKRVRGMRVIGPAWRQPAVGPAAAATTRSAAKVAPPN